VATGIWHGANWTFVVWGAYHGTILLLERRFGIGRDGVTPGRLAWARTLGLVVLGWVFFRSADLGYAFGYLQSLLRPGAGLPEGMAAAIDPVVGIALAIGVASTLLPATWVTGRRLESDPSRLSEMLRLGVVGAALPLSLAFLVASGFSPFLYFQF